MLSSKLLNKDDILCEKPEFLSNIKNSLTDIHIKNSFKNISLEEFNIKEFFINQNYTLCSISFEIEKNQIKIPLKKILEEYFYNQKDVQIVLQGYNSDTGKDLYINSEKNNDVKIEFQCSPTEVTLLILVPNSLLI